MTYSKFSEFDGEFSLSFECGDLPADEAVVASGYEPNGYFWEGIAEVIAPELTQGLELDSEGDLFSASGDRSALESLQVKIEPILASGDAVKAAIAQAEAEGFEFDD